MKLKEINHGETGDLIGYNFLCPGCRKRHAISIGPNGWSYNGSATAPTFFPSVLVQGLETEQDENWQWTGEYVRGVNGEINEMLCHSFVTDGMIEFMPDSRHHLSGKKVELPDFK